MTKTKMLTLLAASAWAVACSQGTAPADLVLRGGAVYTLDSSRSWAEAVAVEGETIVFVGTDEDADVFIGPSTRVVSLDGKMVLPGFHDSHVHPATGGVELAQCNLNGLSTREEIFEAIEACRDARPESEWIEGGGWDLPIFPRANPSRADLDRLVPDKPVYLSSADGHSAWVNSRALEIAGIDESTPNPRNGRIEREEGTARPSGTLREAAMDLVKRHLPKLTVDDYAEGLKRGLAMANRFGITSLIEASTEEEGVVEAYSKLSESDELTVRARLSLYVDPNRDETQVDDLVRTRAAHQGPLLRPDGAKIFADGVIEAGTAALLEPYVGLDHAGELELEPELLDKIVVRLDGEGFQVHTHAIGDRAIRVSLDAFEKALGENGDRDARHHIAHIQLFHPDDIPRFRELGVVANFQPLWAYADTYITDLTEPVLGPERSRWLYPIKSVADSGAVVAAGSDWSVSSMNPLDAIQVALTRCGLTEESCTGWIPEEKVDLDTMLAAYTRNGAYLHHQEHMTGTIEVGKAADLIVLDRNVFEVPVTQIHEVQVLLTLLGGREVYRDEEF